MADAALVAIDCYDLKSCPGTCCSCTVPAAREAGFAGILCDPKDRCEECSGKVACENCGREVAGFDLRTIGSLPAVCMDCLEDGYYTRDERRRRAMARAALLCLGACGLLLFLAAHCGGAS